MSRAGRKILPFRRSGYNDPPAASQQPVHAPEGEDGSAVSLGASRAAKRVQARVEAARGVTLGEPPHVAAATPAATVHLDGVPVRVPLGWAISLSSRRGREAMFVLDARRDLHVLVVDTEGDLRALQGLPADLVDDLTAAHFPRGAQ